MSEQIKKGEIALIITLILSTLAYIFLGLTPIAWGFLIGTAVVTSLCVEPNKVYLVSIVSEIVLALLLFLGINLAIIFAIYVIALIVLELTLKILRQKEALLIMYFLSVLIPLAGIGLFFMLTECFF